MARYNSRKVAAASVAGVVARCVQVGAIDEDEALRLISQELAARGHRPGSDAAKSVLTGAAEVYAAVADPVPESQWYYPRALALLQRAGADLEAARAARRQRKGRGPTAG